MALDPVTSISETVGKALEAAKTWMEQMLDPDKRRLREIEKLNKEIDERQKKVDALEALIAGRYPKE